MKDFSKGVATQATAILLAALGAAAISFISSVAGDAGLQCEPVSNPSNAGFLGAMLKGAHTALTFNRATMSA